MLVLFNTNGCFLICLTGIQRLRVYEYVECLGYLTTIHQNKKEHLQKFQSRTYLSYLKTYYFGICSTFLKLNDRSKLS